MEQNVALNGRKCRIILEAKRMYGFLLFFFFVSVSRFFSEDGLKLAGKWALGENVHIDHQCLMLKRAVEHMKECECEFLTSCVESNFLHIDRPWLSPLRDFVPFFILNEMLLFPRL